MVIFLSQKRTKGFENEIIFIILSGCHLVLHRIDIFYQLDGSSKLTQITTYFQTREHEKLITTFFTEYFPSNIFHLHPFVIKT